MLFAFLHALAGFVAARDLLHHDGPTLRTAPILVDGIGIVRQFIVVDRLLSPFEQFVDILAGFKSDSRSCFGSPCGDTSVVNPEQPVALLKP